MANAGGGASAAAIKAGEAFVALSARDVGLQKGLDMAKAKVMQWAGWSAKIGAVLGAAGGSVLAPVTKLFWDSVDSAKGVGGMAAKWGESAETMSLFAYAAKTAGVGLDDVDSILEQFSRKVAEAAEGGNSLSEAFADVGLDAAAMMKDSPIDQVLQFAEAMKHTESATKRLALEQELGGKSMKELDKLLRSGSQGLYDRMQQGKAVGAEVSQAEADAAGKISGAWKMATAAIGEAFGQIGDNLLVPLSGPIKQVSELIVGISAAVLHFIENNQELTLVVTLVAGALAVVGAALIAIGAAAAAGTVILSGLATAWGVVVAAVGLVMTPVGLVVVALVAAGAAIAALFAFSSDARSAAAEIFGPFVEVVRDLWGTFTQAFGGIIDALKKGDLSLAGEIAMAGLDVVWKKGLVALQMGWVGFKSFLVDSWYAGIAEMEKGWEGFKGQFLKSVAEVEAAKSAIDAEFDRGQQARNAAREKGMEEAVAAAVKAQQTLDNLTKKDEAKKKSDAGKGAAGPGALAAAAKFTEIRGGFAGLSTSAQFASGGVAAKSLKKLEDIDRKLGEIRDKPDDGERFAGGA